MIIKLAILVILYYTVNYLINFLKSHYIHKKIVLSFDYIFIYRPTLFFVIWLMVSLGMYIAYLSNNYNPQWIFKFNFKTFLLFLSITFIMGSIFVNDSKDNLDDNKKRIISKITLCIGLICLLLINIYNIILGLVLYLFLNFIYCNNDIKNNFLLKSFSNTFIGLILLMSGFVFICSHGSYLSLDLTSHGYKTLLLIFLSSLCYLAIFFMVELFNNDSILFNSRRVITFISTLILFFVLLISMYIGNPLLSICTISSIPFYLYALFRNDNKDIIRSIRYPIFIFNFFVATIFPYLAIAVITIFYLSKYYYWHRLNIHYPTFLVEND